MRKIRLICVGKTQDNYLIDGIRTFEKKLKRFCTFSWEIVKESPYKKGTKQQWQDNDFEKLSKFILPGNFTIACDEKGKSLSSIQLADLFQTSAISGHSQIDIFIGGPFGLPAAIITSADMVLSLSPMTFTHQMVRLILIEQVYRAFTIINNIKYHHE